MSACGPVLFLVLFLAISHVISNTEIMLIIVGGGLVLPLASIMLLGASAWKKARPIWALAVALLAPLMLGAWLFTRLYPLVLILQ